MRTSYFLRRLLLLSATPALTACAGLDPCAKNSGIVFGIAGQPPTGLMMPPYSPYFQVGDTAQLAAYSIVEDCAYRVSDVEQVSPGWSSTAPAVATVSSTGRVIARTVGEAWIKVPGASLDFRVAVIPRIATVELRRSRDTVASGSTVVISLAPFSPDGALIVGPFPREIAALDYPWFGFTNLITDIPRSWLLRAGTPGTYVIKGSLHVYRLDGPSGPAPTTTIVVTLP